MATKKKKRRRRRRNDRLVLRLLVLVVFVLVVFEGKLVRTMFSQHGNTADINVVTEKDTESGKDTGTADAAVTAQLPAGSFSGSTVLAGPDLSGDIPAPSAQAATDTAAEPALPASEKIVAEQETPIDDSYFTDAVFIGDSRMAGFQNASGITKGDFLASVGMSIDQFSNAKIQTASSGTINVYQGLSGKQYNKIYFMLGANDLGYQPWSNFKPDVEHIMQEIHKLQPNAVIYIISCIYVEESKVTTDYVNNENVVKVNENLLAACEDLDYCYFINVNDIFDNGYHALIEGASQDGVHLYEKYLKQMLNYLYTHYLTDEQMAQVQAAAATTTTAAGASDTTAASSTSDTSAGSSSTLVGSNLTGNSGT